MGADLGFAGYERVTDLWDGTGAQSGVVSVTNAPYNGIIAPSALVTIGFIGNGTACAT